MTEEPNINELADQLELETGHDFIDTNGNEQDPPLEQRRKHSLGEKLHNMLQTLRPSHLRRVFSRANIRQFIQKNFTQSADSNARLAAAVALGITIGCMPYYFYQIALTYLMARMLKLNKIIAVFACNISLPPFLPFILFSSYWIGCKLFGNEIALKLDDITYSTLGMYVVQYTIGGILLAAMAGALSFIITWGILQLTRRQHRTG